MKDSSYLVNCFILLLSLSKTVVLGQWLEEPFVQWSTTLPNETISGGGAIGSENAVSITPDNNQLFVTLDNGQLVVLDAHYGTIVWKYQPEPKQEGWSIRCQSGVYFGTMTNTNDTTLPQEFAIYAIIDVPFFDTVEDSQSRIIAVSYPQNELLWISDSIPGEIQGTPVISKNHDMANTKYIFFTHNQMVHADESSPYGSFSILQVSPNQGTLLFTEMAGDSLHDPIWNTTRIGDLQQPYGPVGVAHFPITGRYPAGEGNPNDIILWSTSTDNGRGGNGYTRVFQMPTIFFPELAGTLSTTFLREVRWNSVASPILSQNGLHLIFGVRANSVRGWTGTTSFNENGNIVHSLTGNEFNLREAVQKSPVLSTSETQFFVVSSVPVLTAIDTLDGQVLWETLAEETFTASPKVSPDDMLLYTIQANGNITAYNQDNGTIYWTLDCDSIMSSLMVDRGMTLLPPCTAQGEFSLSLDGDYLYYGDIHGTIISLNLSGATKPPSKAPSSSMPSDAPSLLPSSYPISPPSAAPSLHIQGIVESLPTELPSEAPVMETDSPTSEEERSCGDGVVGNGICSDGACCSEHGFCGTTEVHCQTTEDDAQVEEEPNGTCGDGMVGNGICPYVGACCSQDGWCGFGDRFCQPSSGFLLTFKMIPVGICCFGSVLAIALI